MRKEYEKIIEPLLSDLMKLKNVQLCTCALSESSCLRSVGWKPCLLVRMEVRYLKQFGHVIEGLTVIRILWMISHSNEGRSRCSKRIT